MLKGVFRLFIDKENGGQILSMVSGRNSLVDGQNAFVEKTETTYFARITMVRYQPVVAIVGNQQEELENIHSLLGSPRYRVWKLTSGAELLDLAKNVDVDVVIMDYFLSDMKVPVSIEKIKDISRNIRIIIMAEKPSEHLERSARTQGISFFAIKPNDMKYIRDAVRTAILSRQRQNFLVRRQEQKLA